MSVLKKTVIGFFLLWAMTRLLGKKQISHLTLFDYITGITVGSVVAVMISPQDDWKPMAFALLIWAVLTHSFHLLGLQGRSLHRFLDGNPTLVVRNGRVMEENLRKTELNVQEVMSMLRIKGHFNLDEVEFALLETNGQLSVLAKSQFRAVQPRDLHLATSYEGLPTQLMQEGRMIAHGLQEVGLTEDWLKEELGRLGVDPSDIFAAWIGSTGTLVVDRYRDRV